MTQNRLKTDVWVSAHIRQCHAAGTPAFVLHRGDAERGGLLLKINQFSSGCRLLQPQTDMDGDRFWMVVSGEAPVDEARADEMIKKRLAFDTDLWVLEIEDSTTSYQPDAPVQHF